MTAQALTDKYYLHDSSLIRITRAGDSAVLSIELCLWAQENRPDGMPDIAPFDVTLSGVRELSLTVDRDSFVDSDGKSVLPFCVKFFGDSDEKA